MWCTEALDVWSSSPFESLQSEYSSHKSTASLLPSSCPISPAGCQGNHQGEAVNLWMCPLQLHFKCDLPSQPVNLQSYSREITIIKALKSPRELWQFFLPKLTCWLPGQSLRRSHKHLDVSTATTTPAQLREAPCKDTACSNGILPNSISTHPPSSKRTLCGRYFLPKISKFFKTAILTLGIDILTITMVKHDS